MRLTRYLVIGAAVAAGLFVATPAVGKTAAAAPGNCPQGYYCLYEKTSYQGLKYKSKDTRCNKDGSGALKIKSKLPKGAYSLYNNSNLAVEVYNGNGRLLYWTYDKSHRGDADMVSSAHAQDTLCAYK